MLHKARPHLKKHGKKYLAAMLIFTLAVVTFQFGTLNVPKAQAEPSQQWASPVLLTDPTDTYDKFYPNVLPLSDGNHIAIWTQYSASDDKIMAQKFDSDGEVAWKDILFGGPTPKTISNHGLDAWGRSWFTIPAAPDNNGGFYFGYYEDYDNAIIKRIDGNGDTIYSKQLEITDGNHENGQIDMIPDGSGGVYVVWMDVTTESLYLNRFDSTLSQHSDWNPADPKNADGAVLITSGNMPYWQWEAFEPKLIDAGDGTVIVTAMKELQPEVDGIIAKKISSTGAFDTTFGTVEIISPEVRSIWTYNIGTTNDGGFVIAFSNNAAGSGNGYAVHAIKYDNTGQQNWINSLSPSGNHTNGFVRPQVVNAGGSDVIVVYENRTGTVNGTDWNFINAQKLNGATGTGLWNSGNPIVAAEVADRHLELRTQFNQAISDGNNGVYFVYKVDHFALAEIGVQQINNDGTLNFAAAFQFETNKNAGIAAASLDSSGDVMIVYEVDSDKSIFAHRIGEGDPVPSPCGPLAPGQQCGVLELTGTTDIFFHGYDPDGGAEIPKVFFKSANTSASNQEVSLNITADAWSEDQFIGILDLENNNSWTLQVRGPAIFTGTGTNEFTPTTVKAATSVHEFDNGVFSLSLVDANNSIYNMEKDASSGTEANNMLFWTSPGSGYTWTSGNITAPLNVGNSATWESATFTTEITTDENILVNSADNGELGIFGIGINYLIGVPGGTPAGTYTGTITYTLI